MTHERKRGKFALLWEWVSHFETLRGLLDWLLPKWIILTLTGAATTGVALVSTDIGAALVLGLIAIASLAIAWYFIEALRSPSDTKTEPQAAQNTESPDLGSRTISPPAGQLKFVSRFPIGEERFRAAQAEFSSLTRSERSALRRLQIGLSSVDALRKHVENDGLPWSPAIPERLENLFAVRESSGRLAILPEMSDAVERLFPSHAPTVTVVATQQNGPTSPPPTDKIARLADYLEEGVKLRDIYIKGRGSDSVKKEIDRWFTDSLAYIREHLGADYAARYRLVEPSGLAIDRFPIAKMPIVHGIESRLKHLSTFISELRISKI